MRTAAVFVVTVAITVLVAFASPYRALTPGRLGSGHQALRDDCLACHSLLRGATDQKCSRCHEPRDVGVRSVSGAALTAARPRINALHRLLQGNCAACHREHGAASGRGKLVFRHDLLTASAQKDCAACHAQEQPRDAIHADARACATCHRTEAWKPANFNHDRFFVFDRDHPPRCATCHPAGEVARYTCYGCHEHTRANMVSVHREEGIRAIDDCVRCHRSAAEGERERGGGETPMGGRNEEDDD